MQNHSAAAIALGDRVKQTARDHGLDVETFARRHVVERVLFHLETELPPFMVKGGLLWSQTLRPTADGDIVAIRRVSNREMQNAFKIIAGVLAREGITVTRLSPEPKEVSCEYGDPIDRWSFEASCGTIRANSHLDVGYANGMDAYPDRVERKELKSLMKNPSPSGEIFDPRTQPLAAAAAEKLLAVIMQPERDLRTKHLADLVDERLWTGVDCRQVAVEVLRVCRYRDIPLTVCLEHPPALSWEQMKRLGGSWDKLRAAGRTQMTLGDAHDYIKALWSDVHAEMRAEVVREVRRPNYRSTLLDSIVAGKCPVTAYNRAYKPEARG